MAPKILDMLWLLAMPASAPAELLPVIVDVIALYDKTCVGTARAMLNRCAEIQRTSREPDVNSLRLFVELIKLEVTEEVRANGYCCVALQHEGHVGLISQHKHKAKRAQ
jgi:hypothetical protein